MDNYEFLDDPGLKKILVLIIKYVEESIKELNGSGIYGGGTNIYDSNAVKDTLRDVNGNDFYPYTTADAVYYGLTNLSSIIENFNQELSLKALSSEIPTKISELENDRTYQTLQEINNLILDSLPKNLSELNNDKNYQTLSEINELIQSSKLVNISELINDKNYQTDSDVLTTITTEIAKIIAGADTSFDTLKEISDWIKSHDDSASAMNSQIQQNKTDIASLATSLSNYSLSTHNHDSVYLKLSGGTVTGATQFNNYLKLNAWSGYGTGTANFWYNASGKFVEIENATDLKLAGTKVSKEGHTHSYLPLSGGTLSGDINFSNSNGSITWNSAQYQQRIKTTDDATSDTAVFTFQQSSNSGSSFSDLMVIKDNGKVVANTFVGSLSGNAATATKLATARTISLTGSITGSGTFDGSGNLSIATTTNHTHSYLPLSGGTITGNLKVDGYLCGEGITDTAHNHAILIGHSGQDYMNFYEYGGIFRFIKSVNGADAVLGSITSKGWEGNVVGNVTGNCSGSSGSCTGNASTATKLATARTISLTGSVTGSGKFDGSGNLSIATTTNHTHSYLPLSGGTMTGTINSSKVTSTYLAGNQGAAIINSTASAGSYTMLAKMNSTNGYFTHGVYQGRYQFHYTSKSTVNNRTNTYDKILTLLDENGDSYFSGGVYGSIFYPNGTSQLRLSTNNNSHYVYLMGAGACVTNITGSAWVPINASAFTQQSSKLVKENIENMPDEECKKLLSIRPVLFDYKKQFGGEKNNAGMIAEEVLELYPNIVTVPNGYDENEFDEDKGLNNKLLSIDYSKFVPYIIKLLQIQQEEINELKKNN